PAIEKTTTTTTTTSRHLPPPQNPPPSPRHSPPPPPPQNPPPSPPCQQMSQGVTEVTAAVMIVPFHMSQPETIYTSVGGLNSARVQVNGGDGGGFCGGGFCGGGGGGEWRGDGGGLCVGGEWRKVVVVVVFTIAGCYQKR
ncbi:hypothetical protein Tco_1453385, partial [Tanacetum coccineum]